MLTNADEPQWSALHAQCRAAGQGRVGGAKQAFIGVTWARRSIAHKKARLQPG